MPREVWRPSVTVAAIVEREGRFLLVEERDASGLVLNQPAGHWEQGETLLAACVREAREESGYDFSPTALVGIYRWRAPGGETTYLRFAFCGRASEAEAARELDPAIVRTVWMTAEELVVSRSRHRSPLVLRCVEDYLAGRRIPLEMITHFD
jgi:8-oxo-dGTP pyrophosphatase MutT (NUDIX family)